MIRSAKLEDIPYINELLYQVHEIHYQLRPDIFKKGVKKYSDDEIKNIINDKKRNIFVYEEEGKVLGYLFWIIEENDNESHQDIKTLFIDDICVDESSRQKGIGKALYEYIKIFAKENKCYNITLNVWNNNDAYKFYQSLGLKTQKETLEEIL
ncbi:MAG: GNAT family N-acetyltransferase [Bacilli bacterium]|nr:GNAT family N-acetyltransferase [Bacilli bacterium]